MIRFSVILLLSISPFLFAQKSDSLRSDSTNISLKDSTTQSSVFTSDSVKIGMVSSLPDSVVRAPQDSLIKIIPISHLGSIIGFNDSLRSISDDQLPWINFHSFTDIFWKLPHFYTFDLSSPGQNNNITFGGLDNRYVRILIDGRSEEDPFTGVQNIWTISPDEIERIEILSGPSASFYTQNGNAAVINIITKNYYTNKPYTRLRYSQGVNKFTQTDALFTQNIIRGGNLTIGVNHTGYGSNTLSESYRGRYPNANDNGWNIRTKLRYNITNDLNISLSYHYNQATTGLNGGVNSLKTSASDIFDNLNATMYNYEAYEKLTNQHFDVNIITHPFGDTTGTITLTGYTSTFLREYRDEENRVSIISTGLNGIYKKVNYKSDLRGMKFQYASALSFNNLLLFAQYEETAYDILVGATRMQTPMVGVQDEIRIGKLLSLSGFISSVGNTFDNNVGGEMKLSLSDEFSLNGGISQSVYTPYKISEILPLGRTISLPLQKNNFTSLQAGAAFVSNTFSAHLSVVQQKIEKPLVIDTASATNPAYYTPSAYTYQGISADVHLRFGNFHVEGMGNYLLQPDIKRRTLSLTLSPQLYLDGSFYFHGLLAKENLDLKVGFRGRFISQQDGIRPLDEYGVWIPYGLITFGPSGTLDFFAIGKIGDAYIHLIWENLTNTQYMFAPVYPANTTNIRFGIAWEFLN